jgi:hypothetical protein
MSDGKPGIRRLLRTNRLLCEHPELDTFFQTGYSRCQICGCEIQRFGACPECIERGKAQLRKR